MRSCLFKAWAGIRAVAPMPPGCAVHDLTTTGHMNSKDTPPAPQDDTFRTTYAPNAGGKPWHRQLAVLLGMLALGTLLWFIAADAL